MEGLIAWLASWEQWAPLIKAAGVLFAICVTGTSSYAAYVIHLLKRETSRLSDDLGSLREQLEAAKKQNAAHMVATELVEMLRQAGHPKLHAPELPPKAAREARMFPSVFGHALLGLIDGGYVLNRDNVVAFSLDGIHLPKQKSPISWGAFSNSKFHIGDSSLVIAGVRHDDLFGSADADQAFFTKLQRAMKSYLAQDVAA
jgi:hypothetical protein